MLSSLHVATCSKRGGVAPRFLVSYSRVGRMNRACGRMNDVASLSRLTRSRLIEIGFDRDLTSAEFIGVELRFESRQTLSTERACANARSFISRRVESRNRRIGILSSRRYRVRAKSESCARPTNVVCRGDDARRCVVTRSIDTTNNFRANDSRRSPFSRRRV